MKKISISLIALLISLAAASQPLSKNRKSFTRADTLRGSIGPERECFNVDFYHLTVDVDIEAKKIVGNNIVQFLVTKDTRKIQLDLFKNLEIEKVLYEGKSLVFTREENAFFIEFPRVLKNGEHLSVDVHYSGNPQIAKNAPWDGGFVFSTSGDGSVWVSTACQGLGASSWWPTKDHQSDEADSMIIDVIIPDTLMDVSNGRLVSITKLANNKIKVRWKVVNSINNYNVSLNIGKYVHWNDTFLSAEGQRILDLTYYVLPENEEKARKQFEEVKPMLRAFEHYFGPYPFYEDGYKLVETPYLGMEHQSAIAYGNRYKKGYKGFDIWGSGEGLKFDYIIIHESGHEWWGNQITAADIADMWIQEGFTTYSETLFLEYHYGKESALKYINAGKRLIANRIPIIGPRGVNKEGADEMYQKGALIIHTFRNVLNNDALFFEILRGFQKEYRFQPVHTNDWVNYVNAKTGKDFTAFFRQYLEYPKVPKLEYEIQGSTLKYRWIADVEGFSMPIKIKPSGKNDWVWIDVTTNWQEFKGKVKEKQLGFDEEHFYFKK